MDYFYKFTFTDNGLVTHTEYYCEDFPRDWFCTDEVDYCFVNTKDDTIAIESVDDFVERIVCNGMSHNGDRNSVDKFSHKIFTEIGNLKKLGDFVEFHINDGWFQAEVVAPPEIDIEGTIASNMWKPRGMKGVYINGKCLLKEGKYYDGAWYSSYPFEKPCEALTSLIKRLYPSVIDIYIHNSGPLEVEITAEGIKVIEEVLKDVFGCDIGDGISDYVHYGNGGTIERVKYTAVFTNF